MMRVFYQPCIICLMVVIFGLGNPGTRYTNTRHNAGVMALDALVNAFPTAHWSDWKDSAAKYAHIRSGENGGIEYVLVRSTRYMNQSGQTARAFAHTEKDVERLVVVHDDIDVPVGEFKIAFDRGAGGHNGIRSIIDALGTQAFVRVRIGVAPIDDAGVIVKPHKDDVADFVLASFTPAEKNMLNDCLQHVAKAIVCIAEEGIEVAMNRYH